MNYAILGAVLIKLVGAPGTITVPEYAARARGGGGRRGVETANAARARRRRRLLLRRRN